MSNATIAHTREIARQARSAERTQARIAKYSATAYHVHGHVVDEHETSSWNDCVTWGQRKLADNHDVALVEYMEAL